MATIHGSCVAIAGKGVLLRGQPGAGKSDLALRLIEDGAQLVADDRIRLRAVGGGLLASAPDTIAGRLEVRGLGIVRLPYLVEVPVALVVDLVPARAVERLPEPAFFELAGCRLRSVALTPFEHSAPAKVRLALRQVRDDISGP